MSKVRALIPEYDIEGIMNEMHEKLGVLSAKADAAHSRIDRLENGIKSDLSEMKNDLKELSAHMHKGKGYAAAIMFVAGLAGAGLTKILSIVFHQ
jgi:putative component of toxin-antitoxin plasmid stabilization module